MQNEIWIDENIPWAQELFGELGQVVTFYGRNLKSENLKNAGTLLVRSITKVNSQLLAETPVQFVGTCTIGVDHIDLEYIKQNHLEFVSAPGSNANSVAEYMASAFAYLVQEKNVSLKSKKVGIIGWGHVGKKVEKMCCALGMEVLRCDPPLADQGLHPASFFHSLPEILEQCDIITLHVPYTTSGKYPTHHLLNESFFKSWKRGQILLNTSRGNVIEGSALLDSTVEFILLDVFPQEPDHSTEILNRCTLSTPHIAGYSTIGKLNASWMVYQAYCHFKGLPPITQPPFPQPPKALSLPSPSSLPLWTSLVRQVYDIHQDHLQYQQKRLEMGMREGFDFCRKKYPMRFEFFQYSLSSLGLSEPELAPLTLLGFSR